MGKPRSKVNIQWSPRFAYAIGLLTADGNLSPDGRHINFTSKDKQLVQLFRNCLRIKNKIGKKARGYSREKKYFVVQFGDVKFYKFLINIGLSPNKSKTLGILKIPNRYFFDFLRGYFDGDGTFYFYWDKRWQSSFMFYTEFISASRENINWLRDTLLKKLKIKGHVTQYRKTYRLKYAKKESLVLLQRMYYQNNGIYLKRKYFKIQRALSIMRMEF
jgi:intein-encoded DNA endonuclease-like protein